jgi:hypothetical protein
MSMPDDLKTINYRGGLVRFRIPVDWLELYELDGGGEFHDGDPDSGTLRVNVLTFTHEGSGTDQSAFDFVSSLARTRRPQPDVVLHPNGDASIAYWEFGEEDGIALAFRYWTVANLVPPRHMRLAVFSYTILKWQVTVPQFVAEIQLLDDEVRRCEFAKELGVVRS